MSRTVLFAVIAWLGISPAMTASSSPVRIPAAAEPGLHSVDYSMVLQKLLEAVHCLRDATHVMAERQSRLARSKTIDQTNAAVLALQRAMLELSVQRRRLNDIPPAHSSALQLLKRAAQLLRDAERGLAAHPAGASRDAAIELINQALSITQQATREWASGAASSHSARSHLGYEACNGPTSRSLRHHGKSVQERCESFDVSIAGTTTSSNNNQQRRLP
jgi:hypothetical protein